MASHKWSDSSLSAEALKIVTKSSMAGVVAPNLAYSVHPQYSVAERVGSFFFVFGFIGRQDAGNLHRSRWNSVVAVLDVKRKSWSWISYVGIVDQGSSMFLYEDSLYCFGPRDFKGERSGKLSRFDLAFNEWSYCNTVGEGPSARQYFSGHFLQRLNRYVVFGGTGVGVSNDVFMLEITSSRWCKPLVKGKPPSERFQHGSCVHEGVIYVYGGWSGYARCLDELYLLKVGLGQSVTWSCPETNARSFGRLSSFLFISLGRVLLLCGGYSGDLGPNRLGGISSYDPKLQLFTRHNVSDEIERCVGSGACGGLIESGRTIITLGGANLLENAAEITILESTV